MRQDRRNLAAVIILALFLAGIFTMKVMAYGVSEEDAAGIYSGEELYSPNAVSEFSEWFSNKIAHIADDIAGASLGTLLIGLGDSLYCMFSASGLTITAVIYGRVGGALTSLNDNNVFTFEMVKGNFYGITAMAVYSQIRNVFFLAMICVVMFKMTGFIYTGGGQRERVKLVETTKRIIIVSLLLILLPWMMDLFLYMRDSILYAEMLTGTKAVSQFADSLGIDGVELLDAAKVCGRADIANIFRKEASKDPSLMLAVAYFASVIGSVYFFGVYIGYAITTMVLVIFFPFACVLEVVRPGMLVDWIKQLLGLILVPVIDAAIIILPLMCGVANKTGKYVFLSFVELVMLWSIVPARGLIRQWLGLGSSNALEMGGIGAIMGVARLATTIGRTIVDPKSGVIAMAGNAGADNKMADMYMAKAKRADELSESSARDAVDEMGAGVQGDPVGKRIVSSASDKLDSVTGKTSSERAAKREEIVSQAGKDLGHERSLLQEDVDRKTERVATLKARASEKKAESQRLTSRIKAGKSSDPEKDDAEASKAKTMAMHLEAMAASEQKDIAEKKHQIGAIDRSLRYAGGRKGGGGYAGGAGASFGAPGNGDLPDIDDYADINNFEAPEMKGISFERRADLLRQRAARYQRGAVAKTIGAVTGGVTGLSAGAYGGQNMSMMTASIGIEAGSHLGPALIERVDSLDRSSAEAAATVTGGGPGAPDTVTEETRTERVRMSTRREYEEGPVSRTGDPSGMPAAEGFHMDERSLSGNIERLESEAGAPVSQRTGRPGYEDRTDDLADRAAGAASGRLSHLDTDDALMDVDDRVLDQVVLERVRKKTQRMFESDGEVYSSGSMEADSLDSISPETREVYVERAEKVIENVRREYEKTVADLNSTPDGMAANAEYREEAMSAVMNAMPQLAAESGIDLKNLDAEGFQQVMNQATAAYSANYAGLLVRESHLVPSNVEESQSRFAAFMLAAYDSVQASQSEANFIENALAKVGIARPV